MKIVTSCLLWNGLGRTVVSPIPTAIVRFSNNLGKKDIDIKLTSGSSELPSARNSVSLKMNTSTSTRTTSQTTETNTTDMPIHPRFGPMDPVSNIRLVSFDPKPDETALERKYRLLYTDTWKWLDLYWAAHNMKLMQAKREFVESGKKLIEPSSSAPQNNRSSPDLSEFYTQFLKDGRKSHMKFNVEWYRRIGCITMLGMLVELQQLMRGLRARLARKLPPRSPSSNSKAI